MRRLGEIVDELGRDLVYLLHPESFVGAAGAKALLRRCEERVDRLYTHVFGAKPETAWRYQIYRYLDARANPAAPRLEPIMALAAVERWRPVDAAKLEVLVQAWLLDKKAGARPDGARGKYALLRALLRAATGKDWKVRALKDDRKRYLERHPVSRHPHQ